MCLCLCVSVRVCACVCVCVCVCQQSLADTKFTYDEESCPEDFFVPYAWTLAVSQTRDLQWDPHTIQLFPAADAVRERGWTVSLARAVGGSGPHCCAVCPHVCVLLFVRTCRCLIVCVALCWVCPGENGRGLGFCTFGREKHRFMMVRLKLFVFVFVYVYVCVCVYMCECVYVFGVYCMCGCVP